MRIDLQRVRCALPTAERVGLSSQTQDQTRCSLTRYLDKQLLHELSLVLVLSPQGPRYAQERMHSLQETSIVCGLKVCGDEGEHAPLTPAPGAVSWGMLPFWKGHPQTVGSLMGQGCPLAPCVAAQLVQFWPSSEMLASGQGWARA